jgi:hypothetical protein
LKLFVNSGSHLGFLIHRKCPIHIIKDHPIINLVQFGLNQLSFLRKKLLISSLGFYTKTLPCCGSRLGFMVEHLSRILTSDLVVLNLDNLPYSFVKFVQWWPSWMTQQFR